MEDISMADEIIIGLQNNEFQTFYQPVCETATGVCCGAEVLARWNRPDGRIIEPKYFIRAAEQAEIIIQLTHYLFDCIVREVGSWSYGETFRLSVNISPRHLEHPRFIDDMMNFSSDLKNKNIQIMVEITEDIPVTDIQAASLVLSYLRRNGFMTALDDFGTGYNSLSYLRTLPIDCLKIDKSFIDALNLDANNSKILDFIINLGHEFGMDIVAEGVSVERQRVFLMNKNIPLIQGYLNSPPLEYHAFMEWFSLSRGEISTSENML
ncbi:EAL domain-containing protein [Yokenella regensburgei]|uniref:EAL domain-containing protein n=1 Tax=Yokenella regensburgei TaxID=158877 RepID=UPI0014333A61|nr:EAL domain-containing protein [Yokenella regensburgei]QIU88427.1 EAL domain-containing protein [Yokenella regensburgei]